ncbi:hypothetical protein Back11_19170 [Paenibacillus baekrokdamisoli]|uniref:Uncharacterized protein n=1 Tax=Paenibacillus baekrokdamisoli TaxID=1712516 RepID=A0A3G9IQL0_9BACL|nr:TIGR03943 family protein [Paenibacillus baekrokdamisoli]MBB3072516.1 putative repeat protein (TIGR03943 family) [Paenibacillus baekrokdamisoli]BBH20572.1 hypothetical protein Back11_19170 [Paenibacillus baekrokdamisoli]
MEFEEERSYTFHYILRAVIMLGLTFYIVHLVKTDSLLYYIAPRMMIYVKIAALLLFVVAVYQGFLAVKSRFGENQEDCGCDHVPSRSIGVNMFIYSLFVFPLLLGFFLPDTVMGSDVASIKGMNLSATGMVKTAAAAALKSDNAKKNVSSTVNPFSVTAGDSALISPSTPAADQGTMASTGSSTKSLGTPLSAEDIKLQEMFKPDEYTEDYSKLALKLYKKKAPITIKEEGFMELLTAVDLYMDNFVGKKMIVSGFIYREDDMAPNQFVVSRLAMQCCSADSSPYGVVVESNKSKDFPKDTWVTITGTIGKTVYNKNTIMKLDAVKIEKIKASKTPYVYPYFDDFSNLVK